MVKKEGYRALIATVGGSSAPVLLSIKKNQPDKVVFLCTADDENQSGSERTISNAYQEQKPTGTTPVAKKPIAYEAELADGQYDVVIVKPDDPHDSYMTAEKLIRKLKDEGYSVTVDPTGGTKSMSIGTGAAAMSCTDCNLTIVGGIRRDLIKVKPGAEFLRKFTQSPLLLDRQIELANRLFARGDYDGTAEILEELLEQPDIHNMERIQHSLLWVRAMQYWDRFQYAEARQLLATCSQNKLCAALDAQLKMIIGALHWFSDTPCRVFPTRMTEFLSVAYDVLGNADRRAEQGKFEDAVARVYRAIEMYAQFCLRNNNPSILNSQVDIVKLPEILQEKYTKHVDEKGRVQLGLMRSYELLRDLDHPIGSVFQIHKDDLLEVIEQRNYSFLAHGTKPIAQIDWQKIRGVSWAFIAECDKAIGVQGLEKMKSLPREMP